MPVATVNTADVTHEELKTLKDGYVKLRKLSYGEILERRMMLKLEVHAKKGKKSDIAGELAMANKAVTAYEFSKAIVEHNLEDERGRQLNLGDLRDLARLDPAIGQEIENLISEMNNLDDEEESEEGNSTPA